MPSARCFHRRLSYLLTATIWTWSRSHDLMYRAVWGACDYTPTSVYPGLNLPEVCVCEHVCMCTCVFVHACSFLCVCAYVCVCVCVHVCLYMYVHLCVCVCINFVFMCVYVCVHIMCVHMCACVSVCVCVHVCLCMHVRLCVCAFVFMCVYIYMCTAKEGMQDGPIFCPYFPQRRYPVQEIYSINMVPSVPVMGTNRQACFDGHWTKNQISNTRKCAV